ncbi:helix-turn-helix domain-containing protein [Salmonella enterica]
MHKNFYAYIEEALDKTIFDSIQTLAKHLEIPPNRISQWKQGRGSATPAECIHLADLLGIDVREIAFVIEAEKEKINDFKQKWLKKAKIYQKPVNPPNKYKKPKK